MADEDDTLEWARRRADELIASIDDTELLALIRPGPAPPKRREVRYSLAHPVEVQTADWADFIELVTKDISRGGMFVQSVVAPELRSEINVRVRLPERAGKLRLAAEVVHVVSTEQAAASGMAAGFGIQFGELSAERRSMLDHLLVHARRMQADAAGGRGPSLDELGFRCASASGSGLRLTLDDGELAELRELRSELAAMKRRGDLELLGVGEEAELEELRRAFAALAERWRPSVNDEARPEVRTLATEIFLRLEHAYRRLSDPQRLAALAERRSEREREASEREASERAASERVASEQAASERAASEQATSKQASEQASSKSASSKPASSEPVRPHASPSAPANPLPGERRKSRLAAQNLVRRLVDRGTKLTSRLAANPPPVHIPRAEPPRFNHLLGKAYELISNKDYAAAEEVLVSALRIEPSSKRAQVLLHFTRARQAVMARDLDAARRHYEAILRLDPHNDMAKRELVMVSALDH